MFQLRLFVLLVALTTVLAQCGGSKERDNTEEIPLVVSLTPSDAGSVLESVFAIAMPEPHVQTLSEGQFEHIPSYETASTGLFVPANTPTADLTWTVSVKLTNGTIEEHAGSFDLIRPHRAEFSSYTFSVGGVVEVYVCAKDKCDPTRGLRKGRAVRDEIPPDKIIAGGITFGGVANEHVFFDGNTVTEFRSFCGGVFLDLTECVTVWFSNGDVVTIAGPLGCIGIPSTIVLRPAELITSMRLRVGGGIGPLARVGQIHFTTNGGRTFQSCGPPIGQDVPLDVGSGAWVGFFAVPHNLIGGLGEGLRSFGAFFVERVANVAVVNVTYPDLGPEIVARNPETIDKIDINRCFTQEPIDYTRTWTRERELQVTWCVKVSVSAKFNFNVTGHIMMVVDIGGGFEVTLGAEATYQRQHTQTDTDELTVTERVSPGVHAVIDITRSIDHINTRAEAYLELTFLDGTTALIFTDGTYRGVQVSGMNAIRVDTPCEDP